MTMSVRKRKNSKGQLTAEYHYEFMQAGKRFHGVCEGCTTERAALAYEKTFKETQKQLTKQKNVNALVENYKHELTGGVIIDLENAFDQYLTKPRKKQPSSKQQQINLSQWNDFCAFMKDNFPKAHHLEKITKRMAEKYIAHLRSKGRYISEISYERSYGDKKVEHKYKAVKELSPRTVNAFHKTLKSVFSKLKEDAGMLYNPFDFEMLKNESETRDAFSIEELKSIGDNLDEFTRPIFVIGICTGLSEGDICLLRWESIQDGWIVTKRRKTGATLEIPILPPLAEFLINQKEISGEDNFVLPDHAEMYSKNPSGISYRIKQFLDGLGIKTSESVKGRSRKTSKKDVHSLRHTFAYLAGVYQIPLSTVQGILGHTSEAMTTHYQRHADRKAKEKYLAQMPNFLNASTETKAITTGLEPEREQLAELSKTLPIKSVRKILKDIKEETFN